MKRGALDRFWPAPLLFLGLSGCMTAKDSARLGFNWKGVLHSAVRDYAVGDMASDRRNAKRLGDASTERRLSQDIDKLVMADVPIIERAELYYSRARDYDSWAQTADKGTRQAISDQAADRAMEVLRLVPDFHSDDRETLNSLGYMLADRGTTKEQLQAAVKLTSASLKLWDEELDPLGPKAPPSNILTRAMTSRDSLAWALARSGRLVEARQQEERALKEIAATSAQRPLDRSIAFHMAEIYRGLGQFERAKPYYDKAIDKTRGDETSDRAAAGLAALVTQDNAQKKAASDHIHAA